MPDAAEPTCSELLARHAVDLRLEALPPAAVERAKHFFMYRTGLSGQWVALRGAPESLFEPCGACVERAAVAVLLDQPFGVVAGDEGANRVIERLFRTLKEQAVHGWVFRTIDEIRDAIRAFVTRYNAAWLIEKNGHRSPDAMRAAWHEQTFRRAA